MPTGNDSRTPALHLTSAGTGVLTSESEVSDMGTALLFAIIFLIVGLTMALYGWTINEENTHR